jgi:uncharacterized phiE125 gp8 family phage protein
MIRRLTIPAARCVTLEQAKAHLRVDHDLEDDLITALLDAAIDSCADFAGRAFNQAGYRQLFDCWSTRWATFAPALELAIAPIVNVVSVNYQNEDREDVALEAADWHSDTTPSGAVVWFADGFALPTLANAPQPVWIDFTAGYDPPDYSQGEDPELKLPSQARAAILLTLGHLYANREAVVVGKIASDLPQGVKHLLSQVRIYR